MIVYIKCACTVKDRMRVKQLISEGYEVRKTNTNAQWRKEAKSYNVKLPFSVVDGIVTEL